MPGEWGPRELPGAPRCQTRGCEAEAITVFPLPTVPQEGGSAWAGVGNTYLCCLGAHLSELIPETWEKEPVVAVYFGGAVHLDPTQCQMSQGRRVPGAQAQVSQERRDPEAQSQAFLYRPTFLHTHGHTQSPTKTTEAGGHWPQTPWSQPSLLHLIMARDSFRECPTGEICQERAGGSDTGWGRGLAAHGQDAQNHSPEKTHRRRGCPPCGPAT